MIKKYWKPAMLGRTSEHERKWLRNLADILFVRIRVCYEPWTILTRKRVQNVSHESFGGS